MDIDIDVLVELYGLKSMDRAGWVLRGIDDPESVAGHSWGVAFLCLVFHGDLDVDRCVKMGLIHDVVEAETGDIPRCILEGKEDEELKNMEEMEAIERLSDSLGDEVVELYMDYEGEESEEAVFVKDMDIIDMCLQALIYKKKGVDGDISFEGDLDEFLVTSESRLNTEIGNKLFSFIRDEFYSVDRDV